MVDDVCPAGSLILPRRRLEAIALKYVLQFEPVGHTAQDSGAIFIDQLPQVDKVIFFHPRTVFSETRNFQGANSVTQRVRGRRDCDFVAIQGTSLGLFPLGLDFLLETVLEKGLVMTQVKDGYRRACCCCTSWNEFWVRRVRKKARGWTKSGSGVFIISDALGMGSVYDTAVESVDNADGAWNEGPRIDVEWLLYVIF